MVYKNTDSMAKFAMEYDRLGDYDDGYIEYKCPICGSSYLQKIYIDDNENCVGCDICIHELDVEKYYERNI